MRRAQRRARVGSAEGTSDSGRPQGAAPEGAAPVLGCADQRGAGAGDEYSGRGPAPGMRPHDHQPPHVSHRAGGAAVPRAPVDAGEAHAGRGPGHRAGPLAGVVSPPDRFSRTGAVARSDPTNPRCHRRRAARGSHRNHGTDALVANRRMATGVGPARAGSGSPGEIHPKRWATLPRPRTIGQRSA